MVSDGVYTSGQDCIAGDVQHSPRASYYLMVWFEMMARRHRMVSSLIPLSPNVISVLVRRFSSYYPQVLKVDERTARISSINCTL